MRSGNFTYSLTRKFVFFSFLLCLFAYRGLGQVMVMPASGGTNICSNTAVGGSAAGYTTLGTITIMEMAPAGFAVGPNSITLQAPAGWQFNTGSAIALTPSPVSGDIQTLSSTFSAGNLVINFSIGGTANTDVITVSGLQVQATSSSSANGNVFASASTVSGITTGTPGTNFGPLSLMHVFSNVIVNNPVVCPGATTANISYTNIQGFTFTGSPQSFTVPTGVTSVTFDVQGAAGGQESYTGILTPAGMGGRVQGTLTVSSGDVLNLYVGGAGQDGSVTGALGGFNGGGSADPHGVYSGGGGGGASDIRLNGTALTDRVVVAGGGGGNGADQAPPTTFAGGDGGNLIGSDAQFNPAATSAAAGGTQVAGGAGATYPTYLPGDNGSFGAGGNSSTDGYSGGGGGGYYGGGGGVWSGGGGGSSYANSGLVSVSSMIQGYRAGNGIVSISSTPAGTYTIVWDATALAAGFTNVASTPIPASSISVTVLSGLAAGSTYNGTLTFNDGSCTRDMPISVSISPIPTVNTVSDVTYCNGAATTAITFSGSVSGTTFNWTNSNTSIGLPASGTGNIASFTATNTGTAPISATFTVTPTINGCPGTPTTFSFTVNPTPALDVTASGPLSSSMCENTVFAFTQSSLTTGTTYTWSRAAVAGNTANSGTGNISETLTNNTVSPAVVIYVDTLRANGCMNTQNITVTVNPLPVLSSATMDSVCNGSVFSYTPTSGTAATTYMWSRAAVGVNASASGTTGISETLNNGTTAPVTATYIYTLTANSCSNTDSVKVNINPTPALTSSLTATACDSQLFSYTPTSATAGTTYTWSRSAVAGISNTAGSGSGAISEYLDNTTTVPVVVTYDITLMAHGCSNMQSVTVTVNPVPALTSSHALSSICSGTTFNYTPASSIGGATFAWHRAAVTGITNPAASGTGDPAEVLVSTATSSVVVTYVYTITAGSCSSTDSVQVAVMPAPTFTSTHNPPAVCDSTIFNYTPTSSTTGVTFSWTRAYVPGILALAGSGTGSISERLDNSTSFDRTVTYVYTISAGGCSTVDSIQVVVHPSAELVNPKTKTICSGQPVNYTPASFSSSPTVTVSFAWSRAAVTGITPATATGTGAITEVLNSSLSTPVSVVYVYTLSVGGCPNTQAVTVNVNPAIIGATITIKPSSAALCGNTLYQNFGAASAPTAGVSYMWTATNATVYATGTNKQYALVNFNSAGSAKVILNTTSNATGCIGKDSVVVSVGTAQSQMPGVIYVNNQFIALENDVDSYQWGYDEAGTLAPVTLADQINQNYFDNSPDFANKYYWVATKKGDCTQKSYYKTPLGVSSVNKAGVALNVYPNPASQVVNVEVNAENAANLQLVVYNMMGQQLAIVLVTNDKAQINVAALPAGGYLVDCLNGGVKVASARFIKN